MQIYLKAAGVEVSYGPKPHHPLENQGLAQCTFKIVVEIQLLKSKFWLNYDYLNWDCCLSMAIKVWILTPTTKPCWIMSLSTHSFISIDYILKKMQLRCGNKL